jgi:O-antigen/teichoic acid export membrane protein
MSSLGKASLKKTAIRGAIWTILGYGTTQVVRFANNLVLTRLLVPEFFGLMTIVNTVRIGLSLFSDIGIGQNIVKSKRGEEPEFLDTAWTLQILRGFFLWFLCVVFAIPVARFYNESLLIWLMPIAGLTSVFYGFKSTKLYILERNIDQKKYMLFEISSQILGLAVMVIWALINPSVFALAVGGLVTPIAMTAGSHWLLPGESNRLRWDKDAVAEIFSFGKWIFLSTAMIFLAEQSDRLILGKLFDLSLLGVYTIAFTLANMPREVIKMVSHRVIFPVVSRQAELPRSSLREKILQKRRLILLGLAVGLAVLATVGDLVIAFLYDDRYVQATWMMPILSCGVWFSVLFYTMYPCLLGIGKPIYGAQGNILRFTTICLGLPLGFHSAGTLGAITVVACSDLPTYVGLQYGLWREKLNCIGQDALMTLVFALLVSLFVFIRYSIGFGLPIDVLLDSHGIAL